MEKFIHSDDAMPTIIKAGLIHAQFETIHPFLDGNGRTGKWASESATAVLPKLYGQPIVNVSVIQNWTGFTRAGAQTVIDRFIEMEILSPKNKDKKYGQSYIYNVSS